MRMPSGTGTTNIGYIFRLPDNRREVIELRLDEEDLLLRNDIPGELPFWTDLDFHQCPNCPLQMREHPRCPSAVHYVRLLSIFQNLMSYEEVEVKVITTHRITLKRVSAQKAVSSLMGLVNITSGCPHTAFFRPLARFHLPFSDAYETTYRVASMYLLAQYFLSQQGQKADMELRGLQQIYAHVQVINEAMVERLRFASQKDVAVNALTSLDALGKIVQMSIEESLRDFRGLFKSYIRKRGTHSAREQRRQQRIRERLGIDFYYQEHRFVADTIDLSEDGLCIKVPGEPAVNVGSVVDLSISDRRIRTKVVWTKVSSGESLIGLKRIHLAVHAGD